MNKQNIKYYWNICREFMNKEAQSRAEIVSPTATFHFLQDKKTDTEAGVWIAGKKAVICIMQTENNFIDWLYNFVAFPWKLGKDWFHHGYAMKAKRIGKLIDSFICQKLLDGTIFNLEDTVFCGYSQGGAIASILAGEDYACYTYGCPRFIVKKRQSKAINAIIKADIVPKVPPYFKRDGVDVYITDEKGMSFKAHQQYTAKLNEW